MSWAGFDGRGYSRAQWLQHVAETPLFPGCAGVVEHATGIPTLKQALAMNAANYIVNTQRYYENSLGWSHGPHGFADIGDGSNGRPAIWGFNSLSIRGTHSSCDNYSALGFEAMGNRNTEDYSSGPGKIVLDNQHFAIAAIFLKMNKTPDPSNYKAHAHCLHDGHFQCPHENWEALFRASETAAIVGCMNAIGRLPAATGSPAAATVTLYPPQTKPVYASGAWVQTAVNAWIAATKPGLAPLAVNGDLGPATARAVSAYQAAHHLGVDAIAGPQTCASLKFYVP